MRFEIDTDSNKTTEVEASLTMTLAETQTIEALTWGKAFSSSFRASDGVHRLERVSNFCDYVIWRHLSVKYPTVSLKLSTAALLCGFCLISISNPLSFITIPNRVLCNFFLLWKPDAHLLLVNEWNIRTNKRCQFCLFLLLLCAHFTCKCVRDVEML